MSMEARVKQFHTDAALGKSKKTTKEIATLKRFLFKNQEYRFTDNERSRLFSAIQCYFLMFQGDKESLETLILPLIEDGLKMPFSVFGTKHKKTMLKWYSQISGKDFDGVPSSSETLLSDCQLIDVDAVSSSFSILKDATSGEVVSITFLPSDDLHRSIADAFSAGKTVLVDVLEDDQQILSFRCEGDD